MTVIIYVLDLKKGEEFAYISCRFIEEVDYDLH